MGNSNSTNQQRQQSIKDIANHNRQHSQQIQQAHKFSNPSRKFEFPRRKSLELPDLAPLSQSSNYNNQFSRPQAQTSSQPHSYQNRPTLIQSNNDFDDVNTCSNQAKDGPPAWIPQPGTISSPLIDAAVALQAADSKSYFPVVLPQNLNNNNNTGSHNNNTNNNINNNISNQIVTPTINLKLDDSSDLPAYSIADPNPPSKSDEIESHDSTELTDTVLSWRGGGKEVSVRFGNGWKNSVPMSKSENDFITCVKLPPGLHRIAFVVDSNWRVSDDLQTATDDDGQLVNYVEVPKLSDQQFKSIDADNIKQLTHQDEFSTIDFSHQDPTPSSGYTSDIPQMLITYANLESSPPPSPQASNIPLPEPPMLPRQLERVVLNAQPPQITSSNTATVPHGGTLDDNSVLPIPNHVTLRHLTASAIRGGVLAVGTTTRYRRKFISTVYYTSID